MGEVEKAGPHKNRRRRHRDQWWKRQERRFALRSDEARAIAEATCVHGMPSDTCVECLDPLFATEREGT